MFCHAASCLQRAHIAACNILHTPPLITYTHIHSFYSHTLKLLSPLFTYKRGLTNTCSSFQLERVNRVIKNKLIARRTSVIGNRSRASNSEANPLKTQTGFLLEFHNKGGQELELLRQDVVRTELSRE